MQIIRVPVGAFITNCYIAEGQEPGRGFLVDPADNPKKLISILEEKQICPEAILLTHGHFDHILAAEEIKKKYNIPIYACAKEEKTLQDPRINLTAFHMSSYTLKADVYLTDLQVVELAGFSVQMIETPGHTLGSCCYYLKDEGVLFSGDTVFCGSVGRTDFPEGSTAAIVNSLHRLLEALPDDTEVYPGHDTSTTIGYEKRYNPFV